MCGGTKNIRRRNIAKCGLSPRVRGNPRNQRQESTTVRSIPACAGEPAPNQTNRPVSPVYPRVCGGTPILLYGATTYEGLSPRVRGNLSPAKARAAAQRSIPACAGEPRRQAGPVGRWTVYPRVCGGTSLSNGCASSGSGLSPRVRGNRRPTRVIPRRHRSIPACAGEPPSLSRCLPDQRVYPRVCGGTQAATPDPHKRYGLSPRVRGNLAEDGAFAFGVGSIPACAGEPARHQPRKRRRPVYPRVCGGTADHSNGGLTVWGLSPRVRGNLARC